MFKQIKEFFRKETTLVVLIFLVAVGLRAIPEIKAGIWPIGYDTFNTYAAELASYNGPLINWLKTANLLYFLFLPFKLLGWTPDLIVKIFGPLLYGFLSISFYYFARHFLKFSILKSFLAVLFFIFQLAALRLSWDLYRNELGLIFMFLALVQLLKIAKTKNLIYFTILGILIVLSHQLVSVVFLLILIVYLIYLVWQKKYQLLGRLAIGFLPTFLLFIFIINSSGQVLYDPHVIFTSEKHYFWRYFYQYNEVMPYGYLAANIWYLFYLLYGFLLPLAILGFWRWRKNIVLTTMTIWLLVGTFSSLIFAGRGLIVWERWLFLLVVPYSIYAIEGIFTSAEILKIIRFPLLKWRRFSYALATLFWLGLFAFFSWQIWPFLTASYSEAKPPLANDELNNYFPRTMVHNSLGLNDIAPTLEAIEWLNRNAPSGSVIIVDNRYRGLMLTNFDIDNRYIITNPWSESLQESTFEIARQTGYRPVYLIWNISKSIDGFDRIYNSTNRGIYRALPEFYVN